MSDTTCVTGMVAGTTSLTIRGPESADGGCEGKLSNEEIAIRLIMKEADCSRFRAKLGLAWVRRFVEAARNDQYDLQHPNEDDMDEIGYDVFDQVIGHDAVAAPGSAHEAIQDAVLDPTRGELGLSHFIGGGGYCAVKVLVRQFEV